MKKVKEILREIFIDGLSGMATGLFATLIIGTIMHASDWKYREKACNMASGNHHFSHSRTGFHLCISYD